MKEQHKYNPHLSKAIKEANDEEPQTLEKILIITSIIIVIIILYKLFF